MQLANACSPRLSNDGGQSGHHILRQIKENWLLHPLNYEGKAVYVSTRKKPEGNRQMSALIISG